MIIRLLPLFILLSSSLLRAAPEAIIGSDNRKQVMTLETDPFYRSVGLLTDSDKDSFCTATIISSRHILTNGHCVVLFKGFPSPIVRHQALTFFPGKLNQKDAPFGSYAIVKIETFAVWTDSGNADFDVAVLELDRPVSIPSVKLVSFANPHVLERKAISVGGYSGQKAFGTMWNGEGIIESVFDNGQSFAHTADTLPGTSGSLVRMKLNKEWIGVGIHRGNYLGGSTEMNRGVLFNQKVIQAIKNWVKN